MSLHIFTSAAANYIPKARVLAHGVKRHHPGFRVHLVLPDAVPEGLRLDQEPFDSLLTVADLGIESADQWIFKHTLVELSTAVKGPALVKLLSIPDCSAVVYFDPDIVVLAPLDGLVEEFRSASILLTPHLTEPETSLEAIRDNEISALKHGIYNLGFLGVRNCQEGRRFARWWAARLREFCRDDIAQGLFTDQRWADLVPGYFPGCRVLRDPVYNVCTWNLSHRVVEGRLREGLTVRGRPIVFFHFSGFDSGAQQLMLDKYGARMRGLYELRDWYVAECARMGQAEYEKIPWRYARFDNGEPITDEHRRLYRERVDLQKAFPNPFSTGDPNRSYYHWYEANYELEARGGRLPAPSEAAIGPAGRGSPLRRLSTTRPVYRIFLAVSEKDRGRVAAAAADLLERSYQKSDLYLVGPEEMLAEAFADPNLRSRFAILALRRGASYDDAFSEICSRFHDLDFLFVKASTIVPEYWDLRLAWSACSQQGAATISPLLDRHSLNRMREPDVAAGVAGPASELELLDRAYYYSSQTDSVELPQFSDDCFYVLASALRQALALWAKVRPGRMLGIRSFLEATRKLRYSHALADHLCVGTVFAKPEADVPDLSRLYGASGANLSELRRRARRLLATNAAASLPAVTVKMRPRHLHVMHSWGGGLERWVREYCRADRKHCNFVLKSVGTWGAFGQELHLYRHIDDPAPVQVWPLHPAIKGTTAAHAGYEEAFLQILNRFGVERVLVSSLVGHSLEALQKDPRTVLVCHDYYPFCPALNITFDSLCCRCTEEDLTHCTVENPLNRFFRNIPPAHWLSLRAKFIRRVKENQITMVAPAPSVVENYLRLAPDLASCFRVIPHGTPPIPSGPLKLQPEAHDRLRVVILGSLAPQKGLALFEQIKDKLVEFADVFLVGCGAHGKDFAAPRITILAEYEWRQLPDILAQIQPDLGLLLSVVPETFSYTLQELFQLGIPPLATRVGSLADRIEHGVNGFLCEPEPGHVLCSLRELAENRHALARVHARLCQSRSRTVEEMLEDYRELLGSESASPAAYFCPDARQGTERPRTTARAQLFWRTVGGAFSEADSVSVLFALTARPQRLTLRIPPLEPPPVELRLDPSDHPGFMLLEGLRLHAADRRCLWGWDAAAESFAQGPHSQVLFIRRAGEQGALLALTGPDPQWLLPVGPAALGELRRGGTLEFQVSWPSRNQCLSLLVASIVEQRAEGLATGECDYLVDCLSGSDSGELTGSRSKAAHGDHLARQLNAAQARIADLENSWSWRITRPLRTVAGLAIRLTRGRSLFRPTTSASKVVTPR